MGKSTSLPRTCAAAGGRGQVGRAGMGRISSTLRGVHCLVAQARLLVDAGHVGRTPMGCILL